MRRGFTLIELLIFIAIFSVAMVGFIGVLIAVTRVQTTQASRAEVEQQSQFLLQQIQFYVQGARLVDMPTDVAASSLTLRESASAQDPTIISAASGIVTIQQGTGSSQALTSNKVSISNFSFTRHYNLAASSSAFGTESVSYSFTMAASTTNPEQEYSQTVQSSASLLLPVPKIALVQKAKGETSNTGVTSVASTYATGNESGDLLLAVVSNTGTSTATTSLSQVGSSTWTQIVNTTYPSYNQETTIYDVVNYTPGLLAWWKLDDGAGTIAVDSSGNGNNATTTGNPTWTTGELNGALKLNGTTQYACTPGDVVGGGAGTLSAWIYITTYGTGFNTILSNSAEMKFYVIGFGGNRLYFTNDADTHEANGQDNSIPLNQWTHVAVTYTAAGTANFYVNGALNGTPNIAAGAPTVMGSTCIGSLGPSGGDYFPGTIDDVRIYNRVLSAAEIQGLYQNTGPTVTATFSTGVTNPSLFLYEYRGASTVSSYDTSSTFTQSDTGTPTTNSAHPTSSVELLFGALYSNPFTQIPTAGNGYTIEATSTVSQTVIEDQDLYVTGPVSATWNYATLTPSSSAVIVTFK